MAQKTTRAQPDKGNSYRMLSKWIYKTPVATANKKVVNNETGCNWDLTRPLIKRVDFSFWVNGISQLYTGQQIKKHPGWVFFVFLFGILHIFHSLREQYTLSLSMFVNSINSSQSPWKTLEVIQLLRQCLSRHALSWFQRQCAVALPRSDRIP